MNFSHSTKINPEQKRADIDDNYRNTKEHNSLHQLHR